MTLANRFLTSTVLISSTFYVLFFLTPFWFSLEVVLFAAVALFEFFTLARQAPMPCFRLFGVGMGLIVLLVVSLEFGQNRSGEVLFLILGCLFLFLLQFSTKNNSQALLGISITLFGILYVGWFLSFLIKIRFLADGALWVCYLIAVTKASDIGAYCVGSLIGRHHLILHISPQKTVEGFFGGLLLSAIVSSFFYGRLPLHWSLPHVIILGILIGVVGQIGDLSESLMKRACNVKDSGRLLPGMGGVLDAVDSVLFTAPIFYFHLLSVNL